MRLLKEYWFSITILFLVFLGIWLIRSTVLSYNKETREYTVLTKKGEKYILFNLPHGRSTIVEAEKDGEKVFIPVLEIEKIYKEKVSIPCSQFFRNDLKGDGSILKQKMKSGN